MTIQINTDHNVYENESEITSLKKLVQSSLEKYSEHITRIEIHLSDENGNKKGVKDKRCMLEARLEGRQPIAVVSYENTIVEALSDAIKKITSSLNTILEQIKSRH
jgi:hypothetical protein